MQSRTILSIVSKRNRRDTARFFIGPRFLRLLSISNFVICSRYSSSYFFQFGLLSNIVKWKKIVKCVLVRTTHSYSIFVDFLTVKKCSRCSMVVTSPKAFLETIIHEFTSSSSLVFYCSVQL